VAMRHAGTQALAAKRSSVTPGHVRRDPRLVAEDEASGIEIKLLVEPLLRRAAERTIDGLWAAIGRLIDAFAPLECANYFAAAGYDAT
jgi:hypothetical protein